MTHMYKISEAAALLGVSIVTLRRWDRSGSLPSIRTLGGHRRYPKRYIQMYLNGKIEIPTDESNEMKAEKNSEEIEQEKEEKESTKEEKFEQERIKVVYARVSSHKQKKEGNLDRQIDRIIENAHLPKNTKIISEYGSGLNTDRRGLNRLLREVLTVQA